HVAAGLGEEVPPPLGLVSAVVVDGGREHVGSHSQLSRESVLPAVRGRRVRHGGPVTLPWLPGEAGPRPRRLRGLPPRGGGGFAVAGVVRGGGAPPMLVRDRGKPGRMPKEACR